jgi:hypothetical protein
MSWRTLRILIERLPPESATMTALRLLSPADPSVRADPEAGRWSHVEMLLAALVDETRRNGYILLRVNGDKQTKPPKPVPRPGVTSSARPGPLSPQAAERLFKLMHG